MSSISAYTHANLLAGHFCERSDFYWSSIIIAWKSCEVWISNSSLIKRNISCINGIGASIISCARACYRCHCPLLFAIWVCKPISAWKSVGKKATHTDSSERFPLQLWRKSIILNSLPAVHSSTICWQFCVCARKIFHLCQSGSCSWIQQLIFSLPLLLQLNHNDRIICAWKIENCHCAIVVRVRRIRMIYTNQSILIVKSSLKFVLALSKKSQSKESKKPMLFIQSATE